MAGHVAGVVLAAGLSRRFTHGNKLLALVGGEFVVRRTVLAYCQALAETIVVVGYQAAEVRSALGRLDITVVDAADYKSGQSASLRSGVAALGPEARAAVIGVGDQPLLDQATITRLVETWEAAPDVSAVPFYAGRRGNPVVVPSQLFAELQAVQGDRGGRQVVDRHGFTKVDITPAWIGLDVDRLEDLDVLGAGLMLGADAVDSGPSGGLAHE